MKFSIITPNRNGERYLEESIRSIVSQARTGIELEYIVVDGASTDTSMDIIRRYVSHISVVISEPDNGPVNAINKGLSLATGDVVAWLNADDRYHPGAFCRVARAFAARPEAALVFGRCRIIDEQGMEIRRWITHFKEFFFAFPWQFTIQCLNFVSQPTLFFRKTALESAGPVREDLVAAWDYDFILRLWRCGGAVCLREAEPIGDFRWHEGSISGRNFVTQFKEEIAVVKAVAGPFSPQTLIHHGVRWGIVGIYSVMAFVRKIKSAKKNHFFEG